ncbi:MAG: TspO/MBR family protein [Anaerolineales bacterium]
MRREQPAKTIISLLVAMAIPLAIGVLGGLATGVGVETWYPTLQKPGWNPPVWVFTPVWFTLFILMGYASWRIWRLGWDQLAVRSALFFFGLQLVFNLGWSVFFFTFQRLDLAFLEILVLLALIFVTTLRFFNLDRLAGWLMVPYFLWTSFATILSGTLWWLNRGWDWQNT